MTAAPEQALLLSHGDDRLRAIARGLFDGPIDDLTTVGMSLRAAPKGPVDRALATATRGAGVPFKRLVLEGQWRWLWHRLSAAPHSYVIVWNGIKGHRYLATQAAKRLGHSPVFLEEAPFAGRLSVDFRGVNAGNSLPHARSFYDAAGYTADFESLRQTLRPRSSRRTDVDQQQALGNLSETPFIFAPLQVPQDSQITVYGDWITGVEHVVASICDAARRLPEGWHLRIKEHPSAKHSLAPFIRGERVVLDNTTDTFQQVAASRGVVTINSSVGLLAMVWDKPVLALGDAFWGWEPLAVRAGGQEALGAAFERPAWAFDPSLRRAFFGFLLDRYFPTEADVVAGNWPLSALPFPVQSG